MISIRYFTNILNIGNDIYVIGYKKLLTFLRDSGCNFNLRPSKTTSSSLSSSTSSYSRSYRPRPKDRNICLSILDQSSLLVDDVDNFYDDGKCNYFYYL